MNQSKMYPTYAETVNGMENALQNTIDMYEILQMVVMDIRGF